MDSINDILSSLTPGDIDTLKSMTDSVFGGGAEEKSESDAGFDSFLTPDMLIKLSNIMSIMNSKGSDRCRLLEALKPNLSERRRKKADEAMRIMKLLEILPLITDLTKGGDNDTKLQP